MRDTCRSSIVLLALAAGTAWTAFAQTPPAKTGRSPSAGATGNSPTVATVGSLRITRAEFEQGVERALREYKARTGSEPPAEARPSVRRQLLETAIRQRLLMLEAQRKGMLATVEEAEEELKRDPAFQQGGSFFEPKYIALKNANPQAFALAIEELRRTLPWKRLAESMRRENAPDEAMLSARLKRRLSEIAVDYLALRRYEFDGSYPEPREAEVLAYYRSHTKELGGAPLRQVAKDIRHRLRERARNEYDDSALRAAYASMRDSLRGPAVRMRYAVFDTGSTNIPAPSASDLDRYYRGHIADYSTFDAVSGAVVAQPFAEVREDVRRRWMQERSQAAVHSSSARLEEAWRKGRRDPALERVATRVREVGPLPAGATADTGLAGMVLTEALASGLGRDAAGTLPFERGFIVYHVFDVVPDYAPSFEQMRAALRERVTPRRSAEDEAGARALYDADPASFRTGKMMHFSRLVIPVRDYMNIKLTRAEVEDYYKRNIDDYSAPELARVRHILVSPKVPGDEADREARKKAMDLLGRIRAGEKVADLARRHSDDAATRDEGGDVGVFGRGTMLEPFERAAMSLRPGDVSDVVKTEVGYHILESIDYVARRTEPLRYVYTNVAGALATQRASEQTQAAADSLLRTLRTPAQARAAARRLGLSVVSNHHAVGDRNVSSELIPYFEKLENVKPGELYPGVQEYRGLGYVITWMDSLAPPKVPTWEEARRLALDRYRRGGSRRAVLAKRAELDSMMAAGWSLDSLGALFGGLERLHRIGPGGALQGVGGAAITDSLILGTATRPPVLAVGKISEWIDLPSGAVRIRVVSRKDPDPVQFAARLDNERRVRLEHNVQTVFDRMKERYPVRILDPELRAVALPPLPEPL
jgi:parvulin-like peptidyl-prolyl isomerase